MVEQFLEMWADWIFPVILLAAGLGLVIFTHELGHYLGAIAVGIKVEKFALGFGKRLLGFHIGETDFCINAIPLGGYVKMLGQEDAGKIEDQYDDPRAFANKTVPQRMLVISAGVIMNVITGAILFVIVCAVGIDVPAPVVGRVVPGFPAAESEVVWNGVRSESGQVVAAPPGAVAPEARGLPEGARITEMDGKAIELFKDVTSAAVFSERGASVEMVFDYKVGDLTWVGTAKLTAKVDERSGLAKGLRRFGIEPASDLKVARFRGHVPGPLKSEDRLIEVDGRAVTHRPDLLLIEKTLTGAPVSARIARPGKTTGTDEGVVSVTLRPRLLMRPGVRFPTDGSRFRGRAVGVTGDDKAAAASQPGETHQKQTPELVAFRLEDGTRRVMRRDALHGPEVLGLFDMLGLIPRFRVNAVVHRSPAHSAGLEPGDVVLRYGDARLPTFAKFNETSVVADGQPLRITVLRDGEQRTMTVRPNEQNKVGLAPGADLEHLVVAAIRPNSPVAQAKTKISEGARITKVNDQPVSTWFELFAALKASAGKPVTLTHRLGDQPSRTSDLGVLTDKSFDASDYEFSLIEPALPLRIVTVEIHKDPISAVPWGMRETRDLVLEAYRTLFAMGKGNVPATAATGPIGIGHVVIQAARESVVQVVYLMAMISCFLAVMNFLPLPVFDGGLAVLLIIEAIRRKPLPAKVLNVLQIIGLVLIGLVFVAVTFNDIKRLFG